MQKHLIACKQYLVPLTKMNPSEATTASYTSLGDGHITELLNGSTSGSADDSDTSSSQGIQLLSNSKY